MNLLLLKFHLANKATTYILPGVICSIRNLCYVDGHTRVNCPVLLRRRKVCFICESTQRLKAQYPDAPWDRKGRQAATRCSWMINTNVESTNPEKEALLLNNPEEMDMEILAKDKSKLDSTSVTKDKNEFQEAISTLDSVDDEDIDRSNLPTQTDGDSSQKKTGRKEATKRLLHPFVTFNSFSMNI
ncbi:hypothetical protein G6F43_007556 [Rhizopus delemar]|nr:hypothetical protein G6F43_007556 [Rhizopus delemar]